MHAIHAHLNDHAVIISSPCTHACKVGRGHDVSLCTRAHVCHARQMYARCTPYVCMHAQVAVDMAMAMASRRRRREEANHFALPPLPSGASEFAARWPPYVYTCTCLPYVHACIHAQTSLPPDGLPMSALCIHKCTCMPPHAPRHACHTYMLVRHTYMHGQSLSAHPLALLA